MAKVRAEDVENRREPDKDVPPPMGIEPRVKLDFSYRKDIDSLDNM